MPVDTFLNYHDFITVSNRVTHFLQLLSKLPREKRVKAIKRLFQYESTFSTDSVQGIAGIVNIDLQDPVEEPSALTNTSSTAPTTLNYSQVEKVPVVFKLSVEINRSVEHEHYILKALNDMRKYCPNFVGTLGLLNGFVSRVFFETKNPLEEITNIFDVKANAIQTNYLLLEYVGKFTFRHVCKFSDKATVTAAILSVLCALQIAQNKHNFTHYDLHSDNILMREIEPDSYFAYIINDQVVFYPTGGWYPVMIDMGSSYMKGIETRPTRTSISHYHRGLQSTQFDALGDVHHFILSAVSRLEKAETQSDDFCRHFRWIAGRMMHFFRKCSIWRHKGWKQLPCNLFFLFNEAVLKVKANVCKFYVELQSSVVETLALGVALPWQELEPMELEQLRAWFYPHLRAEDPELFEQMLKASIEDICHFLEHLDNDLLTKSDIMVVFALRALVEHACLASTSSIGSNAFVVSKDVMQMFRQVTHGMYPQYPHKLDLERSFRGAACVTRLMRHMMYRFNQPNLDKIQEWYSDIELVNPLQVAQFLQQHTSTRYCCSASSPIYIWDSDREQHIKTTFGDLGIASEDAESPDALKTILRFAVQHHKS
jgi:hypothetical protein